jgi:3-methyl-2-oxobutanoate hydroxymethyltransferase
MPKITPQVWITAYDFFSSRIAEQAGVDTILVGDSLGMTVYGDEDTTKVTREIMARHFTAVQRGAPNTRIVLDFPFGCDRDVLTAVETAEYFNTIGAKYFKIEGGIEMLEIFLELRARGYNIVAHLGLTPQKIARKNWKVQGEVPEKAEEIFLACKKFAAIGIQEIVLECVPEHLAQKIQEYFDTTFPQKKIDIIGIGAGRNLNAQVLVFDDVVGKTPENFSPKFIQTFGNAAEYEQKAVEKFVDAVQQKTFPGEGNVF